MSRTEPSQQPRVVEAVQVVQCIGQVGIELDDSRRLRDKRGLDRGLVRGQVRAAHDSDGSERPEGGTAQPRIEREAALPPMPEGNQEFLIPDKAQVSQGDVGDLGQGFRPGLWSSAASVLAQPPSRLGWTFNETRPRHSFISRVPARPGM